MRIKIEGETRTMRFLSSSYLRLSAVPMFFFAPLRQSFRAKLRKHRHAVPAASFAG